MKNYTDDRAGMVVAMNQPDMSGTKLPSDEGHEVVLLHEHIPFFFITDRDMIATFYHTYDIKTGFHNYFDSSRGNEKITASVKDKIGKDIVADLKLNFLQVRPYEEEDGEWGMEIN